ncbi:cell wall anchor protein [Corynebacterium sp. 335C]
MANADTNATRVQRRHSAGAFDIRNVIGALLGIYGIVLLISAVALDPGTNAAGVAKYSGYNVWTGVALVVVALVFLAWAKLRPVVVPDDVDAPEADAPLTGER